MANRRLDHYDGFEKRLTHIESDQEDIRRLFSLERGQRAAAFEQVLDRMELCERSAARTRKTFEKLDHKFEALDADV